MKIFVTGTDTDVGKTLLSCLLTRALNAAYWKPVQAGIEGGTDSETLSGWIDPDRVLPERFRLTQPMSPNQAAERDGVAVCLDEFQIPVVDTPLVVEGAGGLMVPLNDRELVIDLIAHLDLPVVLAARSGLGTLNHTLLSLEALRARELVCLGIVLFGPSHPENERDLVHWGKVPVLGRIDVDRRLVPEDAEPLLAKLDLGPLRAFWQP
ncbi:dethiobiotin synthase [Sulfidibacter corallicola]|uniref:ATP-dependent dethiobiotin synthetase BioD n=1 Tax=Sulfidibacter corallicola TaxID=2818388 RepID=A0A8A4TV05_SULCO|nr:dethiobiotin synthase [Sulfidibacter corallicola]QTD52852.1 dethiobiotin synthase [Sulfidibacter corallicola]